MKRLTYASFLVLLVSFQCHSAADDSSAVRRLVLAAGRRRAGSDGSTSARPLSHGTGSPLANRRGSDPLLVLRAKIEQRIAAIEQNTEQRLAAIEELLHGGASEEVRPNSEEGQQPIRWHNLRTLLRGDVRESTVLIPVVVVTKYYRRKGSSGTWRRLKPGDKKDPSRYDIQEQKEVAQEAQRRKKGSEEEWCTYTGTDHDDSYEYRMVPKMQPFTERHTVVPSVAQALHAQDTNIAELWSVLVCQQRDFAALQAELEKQDVLPPMPESKYAGTKGPPRAVRRSSSVRSSAQHYWQQLGDTLAGNPDTLVLHGTPSTRFPRLVSSKKT